MKVFVALALFVATASAGFDTPSDQAVHPRDLAAILAQPEGIQGRITNGKEATEGQFAYQIGLSFSSRGGGWWCGGSLIDNNWVLTAAHCTSGATGVTVYLGSTVRTNPKLSYTVDSRNFVQHKSYNSLTLANDISLIKIPSVSYSRYISNIALPKISSSYSTYSGVNAIASGWGLISDSAIAVNSKLQYAQLQVIDNSVCAKTYGPLTVTSKTICTATPSGTSTCSGDSGGPLVADGVLIGVTSFVSRAGCQSGAPAGFVRVTYFLDWIRQNSGVAS
nr:serine protease 1 [Bactrocera oleae]